MKFSEKLAKQRRANNLSQEQLADMLKVSRQSISKWESGESYPDMAKIIQVCKALNCSLNDIIDDEVMSDAAIENQKDKKNYLEDFLNYITKTYNMFIHMNLKSKIIMIFEMLFLILILFIAITVISNGVMLFLGRLISLILPDKIYYPIYELLKTLILAVCSVIALIILFHLFKIRYLDYYVTIVDQNVNKQKVEEPIKENLDDSPLKKEKKDPIVVIRDPKHSSSKFFMGLANVTVLFLKIFLLILTIPIVFALLIGIATFVFFILNKAPFFKSVAITSLGVGILCYLIVNYVYNILFSRKQPYKTFLIILLSSLFIIGSGIGFSIYNFSKLKVLSENDNQDLIEEKYVIDDFKENDILRFGSPNYNLIFVIDEQAKDAEIAIKHLKEINIYQGFFDYDDSRTEYFFHAEGNPLSIIQQLLADINAGIIRNYDFSELYNIEITCNSTTKQIIENSLYHQNLGSIISEGKQYFLTVGQEGVYYIEYSTADFSGGCQNADETPFEIGDRVWLSDLQDIEDISLVSFKAFDRNGKIVWSANGSELINHWQVISE